MKISMLQIAIVTLIVRTMTAVKVDLNAFSYPINIFFLPLNMNHSQSDTAQDIIIDTPYGMIPDKIPQSEKEKTQDRLDQGWYESKKFQNEIYRVKEILNYKFSQKSNKFKKGARITPKMEDDIKLETYGIFFDAVDQNFDGKMDIKELAVLVGTMGTNMSTGELKRSFGIMDNDGNGFVDMYEWQVTAPEFLPLGVAQKK